MSRIVSVTPTPVEREARTFKEAATFSRHGHTSIVVEAQPGSEPVDGLPFVVHGRGTALAPSGAPTVPPQAAPGRRLWHLVPAGLRRRGQRLLHVPLTIGLFLAGERAAAGALPPADLYWLHGYHQFPRVRLAARREGVPFVYDAHDFYAELIEGGSGTELERRAMRWFYARLERHCTRKAAEVITVSDGLSALIANRTGRHAHVVRNCADTRLDRAGHGSLRAALGLPGDALLVVVVGNHKPGMRATEAISALAALPESTHLAFVGRGYEAAQRHADAVGVGGRAHFPGSVPALDVPSFIASADLAAVIYDDSSRNLRSALPNGFFAALGAGLPVLYPELPEIRRLAQVHRFGLAIDPSDVASVRAAVQRLADDRAELASLRASAESARTALSWEHEEPVLLEVVARLGGA